jgi:predicted O-linked N-acetylglucosamine transferase (SPINDLY family)
MAKGGMGSVPPIATAAFARPALFLYGDPRHPPIAQETPLSSPLHMPPRQIVEALQRGFLAFQGGDLGKAEAAFKKVLSRDERQFDALHMLAVIHAQRGNYPEGIRLISRALAVNPAFAEAHVNLGRMQAETGDFHAAAESYRRALGLNPRLPVAHSNYSAVLRNLGGREEALKHSEAAVTMAPNYADAWHNRGNVLLDMGRYDDARVSFERTLACDPASAYAFGHRLYAKLHVCDWSNYAQEISRVESQVQESAAVTLPFFFVAMSSSASGQLKCATDYVNGKFPAAARPLAAGRAYAHDKIRVAYLSSDLRLHPVANQIAGVFEQHDRSRFEVTAVSLASDGASDMRNRLVGAFDRFIDAGSLGDQAIAETIRNLEIDIAVDLNGLGLHCRPGILARRPAPVQVNYLGYPGTTAAPYVDYLIADRTVIPAADQRFYSEKIVCLPGTLMPNDDRRPCPATALTTRRDEGLPERGFVFCAFNATFKFTPPVFDVWMRLLRQIDGSVLWVRDASKAATENLRREAGKRGVAAGRLVFAKFATSMETHLARHRLAGLFLDTLPYNAHTTASDALWMGVPVVTCAGATFAGRVAASLLQAAGVEDLITTSLEEYEKLALKLAQDPALLDSLRARIEAARRASPLFDTARFTRGLEAAYVQMWQRLQRSEPPSAFSVDAPGS